MKELKISIKAFILFSILLGLVYPLFITALAQVLMPNKANGSLVKKNGIIIGSLLIGQSFTDPKYFLPRPSAANYDASASGADNLGPSSRKLMDLAAERINYARKMNGLSGGAIPADMVLASASGLDPHISPGNALVQAARIARIRKIPESSIVEIIRRNTDKDFIGIWGRSGVNVLEANIELDSLQVKK